MLTTNATDLLVAANTGMTVTTGPGAGFTQRILTIPDADILEDEVVTKAGTYVGSAPISPSGSWIMQMIALRAAGVASPTPTPVPTPSLVSTKWIALMNAEISSASPSSAELLQWINANPPAGN